MKKVIIIGAGIAGLTTGCHLQMMGYETEIIEKHSIAGGLCTSWNRSGYRFDGCIHWLLGSDRGSAFYGLWSELIDMEKIEFVNHSERVTIEVREHVDRYGSKLFHLYTDLDKLEKYLMDLSSADAELIQELIASIRYLQKFELPPLADKAPAVRTVWDQLKMVKYIPFLVFMKKWNNITNVKFAQRFHDPFLKEAFELLFEGKEFTMLAMTMQLAYFSMGCAGYPIGGSYEFAKHLEERYNSLGGIIRYNSGVRKILTRDNTAVGIETENHQTVEGDIIVSAADWNYTIFQALEGKYTDQTILKLREQKVYEVFESEFLISVGVNGAFDQMPHLLRFPLEDPIRLEDGSEYDRMEAHIYNYDRTMAPDGKTTISVSLTAQNADYWIELRQKDYEGYKAAKEKLGKDVIDRLDQKFGRIRDCVEVTDVATPATFNRYTGNWKGSIQGWMPSGDLFAPSSVRHVLPGLKNFYMTGHWMEPGGGLPVALMMGRNVAYRINQQDR